MWDFKFLKIFRGYILYPHIYIYMGGCFEDEIQVESWDLSSQGALYTSAEDMCIISFRILHVKQNFFKVNFPFVVSC